MVRAPGLRASALNVQLCRASYVPRVLEGLALLAVVCHGALRVRRVTSAAPPGRRAAVRLKSTGPGVRVRTGRITIRKQLQV